MYEFVRHHDSSALPRRGRRSPRCPRRRARKSASGGARCPAKPALPASAPTGEPLAAEREVLEPALTELPPVAAAPEAPPLAEAPSVLNPEDPSAPEPPLTRALRRSAKSALRSSAAPEAGRSSLRPYPRSLPIPSTSARSRRSRRLRPALFTRSLADALTRARSRQRAPLLRSRARLHQPRRRFLGQQPGKRICRRKRSLRCSKTGRGSVAARFPSTPRSTSAWPSRAAASSVQRDLAAGRRRAERLREAPRVVPCSSRTVRAWDLARTRF